MMRSIRRRSSAAVLMLLTLSLTPLQAQRRHFVRPPLAALPAPTAVIPAGQFRGTDSADAPHARRSVTQPVLSNGRASWRIETDTLDWRPKATLRLLLESSDSAVIVFRAATPTPPPPGTYAVKLLASGVSHADPAALTADVTIREGGRGRRYSVGGSDDRITIHSIDPEGVVRGSFVLTGFRHADAKPNEVMPEIVNRNLEGTFAASRNDAQAPRPTMNLRLQASILTRALDGFIMTWSGAINGDGDADSTRTPALAREFVESRWGSAVRIDSLSTNAEHFYLRLRGREIPIFCAVSDDDDRVRCGSHR